MDLTDKNKTIHVEFIDPDGRILENERQDIAIAIRKALVERSATLYLKVKVRAVYDKDEKSVHYIAYLVHRLIYYFEAVRFEISNGLLVSIMRNYDEAHDAWATVEPPAEDLSDPKPVDFVAGTAFDDVPSAVQAVKTIVDAAKLAGYNAIALIGNDATREAYKKYLTGKLKAFCNIGHGNSESILVKDGTLSYTWFNSLLNDALKPEVIYFNSSQTYNNPLLKSVATHGSRTYIAGIKDLPIHTSDHMTASFCPVS